VTDPSPPLPTAPAWIHKRDGRLVPFEADKLSRALFAATEGLGRPDAFLARELADGVVHFLTRDGEGAVPTTAQVAELTVKVVRELGQPALAQAFADFARTRAASGKAGPVAERPAGPAGDVTPARPELVLRFHADTPLPALLDECRRQYTLRNVFARDLVAVQGDGLLTLTGLQAPFELAGCMLGAPADALPGVLEALQAGRQLAGGFVALDGPEYALARSGAGTEAVAGWLRELEIGLRATGLGVVVNLNSTLPPSWADDLAAGPLFASARRPLDQGSLADLAWALGEQVSGAAPDRVRIDWHLGERDFLPAAAGRLTQLVRAALSGAPLAFAFDRPRRPVPLGEGIDRRHPAVLVAVELHLPSLAAYVAGGPGPAEAFLKKLGSLARLALSAAVQKRDFLRRHSQERPVVTRGFLLQRARLVVVPVGLDVAVSTLLGRPPWDAAALEYGRQVVEHLAKVLRQDGQASRLETCLEGSQLRAPGERPDEVEVQLRTAAVLHGAAELGTVVVRLGPEQSPAGERVADWLRRTWQHSDVARVRLARQPASGRQLTVPWPEERP
jgi:hypothetical protein